MALQLLPTVLKQLVVFDNVEDAFKELDQKEYQSVATALSSYLSALVSKGFTRREAIRLVESYAKFVYEWALEDALSEKIPPFDDFPDED